MEKNVIVTDKSGVQIGLTYPKRARGLVKNGRAEYVSDREIVLLDRGENVAQAPANTEEFTMSNIIDTDARNINFDSTADGNFQAPAVTEAAKMSNIINFNARDFKLDGTAGDGNFGDRVFITTDVGSTEVWQLGDWQWQWCQIYCEKTLEKNTDYVLRFAVSGGYCDTWDANTGVQLYATDGFESLEAAWEERMAFRLDNDLFAPVLSKNDRNGVLRVFEIPFNTGNSANWRIVFTAQHAVTRFMAARDNSAYEGLDDLTLAELMNAKTVFDEDKEWSNESGNRKLNLSGAVIADVGALKDILCRLPGDADIDLSGAVIGEA